MGISVKRFPLICEEMPTKGHQGSSLVGKNCLHNFLERMFDRKVNVIMI